jgi:hypothetical protein
MRLDQPKGHPNSAADRPVAAQQDSHTHTQIDQLEEKHQVAGMFVVALGEEVQEEVVAARNHEARIAD